MASKQHLHPSDNTGSAILTQFPPRISVGSSVLASAIGLPPQPHIAYSVYNVSGATIAGNSLDLLEQARRRVWQENASHPIIDSLFSCVSVTRDSLSLYIFAVGSGETASVAETALQNLTLDGLSLLESSRFAITGLYPCSVACSTLPTPCPTCLELSTNSPGPGWIHPTSTPLSSVCLLPRVPIRHIYAEFVRALRERLIDDISTASQVKGAAGRSAVRFKDGFLLSPSLSASSSEWGAGWDHRALQRTFMHCQLQIELTPSRILIHPVLRPTCYLPLHNMLPIPAGTPIVLLPHCVPAYYLSTYTGPVGGLTAQFDSALVGLGAGDWKRPVNSASNGAQSMVTYVILWLAVQNKQGEDKGISAIWPANLCITFSPAARHIPPPLSYVPALPAQLQASPPITAMQAPPATISAKSVLSAFTPSMTASSAPSPAADQHLPPSLQSRRTTPNLVESNHDQAPIAPQPMHPFQGPRSPMSDSLRAFRTLTLASRDDGRVASEVSGYVDAVVKEREKERERLRREREGTSSRVGASNVKAEEKGMGGGHNKSSPVPAATVKAGATETSNGPALHQALSPSLHEDVPDVPMDDLHADVGSLVHTSPPAHEVVAELLPPPEILPSGTTRPAEASSSQPVATSTAPVVPSLAAPVEINPQFGSFGTFDNGWNQGNGEFLNLDMDIDNFDVGIDYSMGMDVNGDVTGGFDMSAGFGPLTDDDFNFFDTPATRATVSAGLSAPSNASLGFVTTPAVNTSVQASGPGPPSGLTQTQALPWVSQTLREGLTPRSMDTPGTAVSLPPDLIPTTPTMTPPSSSAPVTPTVMLSDHAQSGHGRKGSAGSLGSTLFDPIPFAEAHKLSDGKYALGKFALPTPPDEEDRTHPIPIRRPLPRHFGDWKISYTAVTDPRVGIIRRLKRKRCKTEDDGRIREGRMSPAWMNEREEWTDSSPGPGVDTDMDEAPSESEDEDEELFEDERDAEVTSRAHTPPPAYLPLGPTLIPTHFCHSYLLPISSPLRPPGANLNNPVGVGVGPMSVPTPVSPAAVLGDASEKSKALEDAAQILVKELIENPVWERSWRAGALATYASKRVPAEVWQIDVQYLKQLLCSVDWLQAPLNLRLAFSDDEAGNVMSIQELDCPLLAVGKADTIIQVLPSALRFWEKLGLTPRAGSKDVNSFVLFEGSEDDKEQQLADWLNGVSAAYEAKHFGKHIPGKAASCVRDGLVPIHLDAIRKALPSFIASLPDPDSPAVFYIVLPAHVINLSSPVLRRVLSAIKKASKLPQSVPRVFQLVPEPFVMGGLNTPSMSHSGLELLAASVYDRLRMRTKRTMARSLIPGSDSNVDALFQEPAFILAHVAQKKVKYLREAHPSSLDVLDRHMFLHVAYLISSCGKWLFMAIIDQSGSAHDLWALLIPSDSEESFVVSGVWAFALSMAMKANVEWHIVIAKLGFMSAGEFDAWSSYLEPEVLTSDPPLRVALLAAEVDNRWHFLSPEQLQATRSPVSLSRSPKVAPGTGFSDISATTYTLQPGIRFTLAVPSTHHLSPGYACIPDPEDEKTTEVLGMRPQLTTTMLRIPAGSDYTPISMLHLHLLGSVQSPQSTATADEVTLQEVARNYHDLSILSSQRWRLKVNPILPFHLAALEVMQLALDKGDAIVD